MREDIKKIRDVLKEYAKLKKELANFSQLASPAMDSVSCHVHKNGVENSLVHYTDQAYKVKKIEDALNSIDDPRYQFILHDYIMNKRFRRNEACERLFSQCSENLIMLKNKALRNLLVSIVKKCKVIVLELIICDTLLLDKKETSCQGGTNHGMLN